MNINEHMNQLGQIGSVGYAPTEAMIDDLLSRTKRARAVRQGSAAVVGSVSAIALGVVGAQVYVAIDHRNDAANQDRNIENGIPGIFDFDSKYGSGYTGIDQASKERFDKIYEDLNLAAQIQAKRLAEKAAAEAAAAAAATAAAGTTDTKTGTTTSCVYEEREYNGGIKYRGPATGCEWVFPDAPPSDPSTFANPWEGYPTTCGSDGKWTAPGGVGYYNCSTGKWSFVASYFMFGNGEVYKCQNWTDAATGAAFQGAISNNPVSGTNSGGWEDKRIYCQVGKTYTSPVSNYTYMGSDLAASNYPVCTGKTKTHLNAPWQYSCTTFNWIMMDPTNYKYLNECGQYYDIRQPATWPEGWTWDNGWRLIIVTPPPVDPPVEPPTA